MRNPIYSLLIGQMDNDLVNNDHQALSQSHGINSILYLLFILLEFCKKKKYYVFKSFVLFHASLSYPANTLKYLNREDTKHTFLYFTDFEVIPAEVNAIKQILNKQDSTRPIYTFIALRTIILQSVHGVNNSLSFIIKHADICSYHRKNT